MVVSLGVGSSVSDLPLVEAVKQSDTEKVRTLLKTSIQVNTTEIDGTTALHWAAHRDDLDVVDLLIDAGAEVDVTNRYLVTPLSLAAQNGNAAILERLLKAGADPNRAISSGETPLMTAARTGTVDSVKLLLAYGSDVNAREETRAQTALMWAAVAGNGEAIKVLIESGADVHARSTTPTNMGVGAGGGTRPVELARSEVDPSWPSYGSMTALTFAARRGQIDSARALLDGGANVNEGAVVIPNYGPSSALMLAIANGHYEFAGYLLDRGADPNDARQGWTALHQLARGRAESGKTRLNNGWTLGPNLTGNISGLELAEKLIAKNADVNNRATEEFEDYYRRQSTSRVGATPLLMAARVSDFELMKVLLDNGADPTIATIDGVTPLMATAGVAIRTAGEDGVDEDSPVAVQLLLDTGLVDVNAADVGGWTPLHGAAFRGVLENIQLLVDAGAQLDIKAHGKANLKTDLGKSAEGWLPVDVADGIRITWSSIFFQQKEAAKLLRQLMAEQGLPVPEDTGLQRGAVALVAQP